MAAPAKLQESINAPWKPAPTAASQRAVEMLSVGLLLLLLLLVQLPLIWMIVTAFKREGSAFRLDFVPQTRLLYPPADQPALPVATLGPGTYIEVSWKAGGSAAAFEYSQGGEEKSAKMHLAAPGLWTGVVGPVAAGDLRWRVAVDGGDSSPRETVAIPAGARIVPLGSPDRGAAWVDNGTLNVSWSAAKGPALSVESGGKETSLSSKGNGLFSGPAAGETVRVVERRSFGEAAAAMYTLGNFEGIFNSKDFQFGKYFVNSLIVATSAALWTVLLCTLAGYAFATKHFHFRDKLFGLFLASMLVPGMIYMVPQFSITIGMGLLNTYTGMVLPHLANVFGLFLLRQYIAQIPRDLFAAAEIDGAGEVRIFQTIVIPLCLPIMVTLFLLVFVGQWSNFLWQLITTTGKSDVMTLPVGLQRFKGQFGNEWEKIMAGACFSILPIAALFLSLQKYFLQGLTAGAVKE